LRIYNKKIIFATYLTPKMNYILFDGDRRDALLPFTLTRPIAEIRVGILTIRQKWEHYLKKSISTITEDYLSEKFPKTETQQNILINSNFLPNETLVRQILNLTENQIITQNNRIIAFYTENTQEKHNFDLYNSIEFSHKCLTIDNTWDIFKKNAEAIQADFEMLTQGRKSQPIPTSVNAIAPENIFIEKGAKLEFVTLNASTGVIYVGKNSEIMENSVIRGPFVLGEGAQIKMGTKIYGATTIGNHSRVGGEISNSVMMEYSNKAHDGFLGNSVIGQWCNLGAGTNNSNLKNNYQKIKLWSYSTKKFEKTELQFCGLMMGDHSKCAINTMFNTGTVVGVSANVFGDGFPSKFIDSFIWGKTNDYQIDKAIETARIVMNRRNKKFTEEDEKIFKYILENR